MDFKKLATQYKDELMNHILPFWLECSQDYEYGGYFTCLDRQGNVFDTDKFISAIHEDWKAAVDISTLARELIIINTLFRADLLFYRNMISEPGDLYSAISWALFKFGNKPLTKELLESIATEKNLLQIKNSYIFTRVC